MELSTIVSLAKNKWKDLLIAHGADPACLNGKHGPCPWCAGTDRFRFDDKNGSGSFICTRCGAGYGLKFLSRLLNLTSNSDLPKVLEVAARYLGIEDIANKDTAFLEEYNRTSNATEAFRKIFGDRGANDASLRRRASRKLKKLTAPSSAKPGQGCGEKRVTIPKSEIPGQGCDVTIAQNGAKTCHNPQNPAVSHSKTGGPIVTLHGIVTQTRQIQEKEGVTMSQSGDCDSHTAPIVTGNGHTTQKNSVESDKCDTQNGHTTQKNSVESDKCDTIEGHWPDCDTEYGHNPYEDRSHWPDCDTEYGHNPYEDRSHWPDCDTDFDLPVTIPAPLQCDTPVLSVTLQEIVTDNPVPAASIQEQEEAEKDSKRQKTALNIWKESLPGREEISDYLASRGVVVPVPDSLRYHAKKNMVVSLLQDGAGTERAISRTFLNPSVPKNERKKMLGPAKGCAVRLATIHDVDNGCLAIGEGVETCLSFFQATGIPTWSCLTEGGIKSFEIPDLGLKHIYILVDVDELKNIRGVPRRAGEATSIETANRLVSTGLEVSLVWPGKFDGPKMDFNDLLQKDPTGRTIRDALENAQHIEAPKGGDEADWCDLLRMSGRSPLPNLSNVALILEKHPAFANKLAFNEFRQTLFLLEQPPWADETKEWKVRDFDDHDNLSMVRWFQGVELGQYAMPRVGTETTRQAVDNVGYQNMIHPIKDWFDTLQWDGEERISTWLPTYLNVHDSAYSRAVSRAWLIAAIARIYQPGCKADGVLVLVGEQGARKSKALSILGGKWFRDSAFDMSTKDAFVQLRGAWMYELAELSALAKSDVERIKAFMSSQIDVYRPPYGRSIVEIPRQVVFAATTNNPEFLKDPTGNRRFWPVTVGTIDSVGLTEVREQLIAEAIVAYNSGEKWWLQKELKEDAKAEQAMYMIDDPWEEQVYLLIKDSESVTVTEVLQTLESNPSRWMPGWNARVGILLNKLGWKKRRETDGRGQRVRRYYRPENVHPGQDEGSRGWPQKVVQFQGSVHPVQGVQVYPIKAENDRWSVQGGKCDSESFAPDTTNEPYIGVQGAKLDTLASDDSKPPPKGGIRKRFML